MAHQHYISPPERFSITASLPHHPAASPASDQPPAQASLTHLQALARPDSHRWARRLHAGALRDGRIGLHAVYQEQQPTGWSLVVRAHRFPAPFDRPQGARPVAKPPQPIAMRGDHTDPSVLTVAQAAAALGVHTRTLRRYLASGLIACHRLPGGHYRIPRESIADFWRQTDRALRRGRHRPAAPDPHALDPRSSRTAPPDARRAPARYDLSDKTLAALRAELAPGSKKRTGAEHDG